jgi:hypothetical protein
VLYQNLFHRSWLGYIKRMGVYTCINLVGAAACWFLCLQLAPSNSLVTFVVRLAVIGAVFPLIWLITTHRTDEFNAMLDIARRFVKKRGES